MSRNVQAGQTIRLRALFRNDLNEEVEASNVYVHIFEPDVDVSDLDNAILVSGVPLYLGDGVFEYEYETPDVGPAGEWIDRWEGDLEFQALDSSLSFIVTTSGLITELPQQLYENNIVTVTIPSTIAATDTTTLCDDYEFEFLTTVSPAYSNLRKVRLSIGGFASNLEDDVLMAAILEASLDADSITFTTYRPNNAFYLHARREYVTCLAASNIIGNINNGTLKYKSLDNFSVAYDTTGIKDMADRLEACIEKWGPQIMAGGGLKYAQQPSMVIKGERDPDRITSSRMWEDTNCSPRKIPGANTNISPSGKRRQLKSFKNKWKW